MLYLILRNIGTAKTDPKTFLLVRLAKILNLGSASQLGVGGDIYSFTRPHINHAKVEKLEKKTYKVEKIVKSTKIPIKPKKSQKKPKAVASLRTLVLV